MSNVFSMNLKKFRLQKNYTQEQVAEILGVSTQTISRWECNTTLPEVTLLPEIARLYCVTVDDFFKDNTSAYENYFQRLACVYERTKEPEDFIRADAEFKSLLKEGDCTLRDWYLYACIHQFMMFYCKKKALNLYDEIIENKRDESDKHYWLVKAAKANFCVNTGNGDDFIKKQLEVVKDNPDNANELCVYIRALYYAGRCEEGYEYFVKAIHRFPDEGMLYDAGGDICRKLKKYDEAFIYWDKASQLNNGFLLDGMYSKAYCYEELGQYEKAHQTWLEIIDGLRKEGYEVQIESAEKHAQECLERIEK